MVVRVIRLIRLIRAIRAIRVIRFISVRPGPPPKRPGVHSVQVSSLSRMPEGVIRAP